MEVKGSRSSYSSEVTHRSRDSSSTYTPAIGSRQTTVIQRSSGMPGYRGSIGYDIRQSYSSGLNLAPGTASHVSNEGVNHIKEDRAREKKDMRELNERLASYIEKVRFLEAQNKALLAELEKLRRPVDLDKIKQMYESELNQARLVIDELSKEKANFDVKIVSLEDQLQFERSEREREAREKAELQAKADRLSDHIGELEGELVTLRGRVESLEDENKRLRDQLRKYQDEINRLRSDLDNETLAHINESNLRQSLEEQLAFITGVYEAEIKELTILANRDTTIEMREFWKGEMSKAMRDIQTEYDERLDLIRNDIESKYSFQLRELRAGSQKDTFESTHMREELKKTKEKLSDLQAKNADLAARCASLTEMNRELESQLSKALEDLEEQRIKYEAELARCRREMEEVLRELQTLSDAKLSLELEIAAYRKLLESEENRFTLKKAVEIAGNYVTRSGSAMEQISQSSGLQSSESVGRLTVQKTARGSIGIPEISPDGRFVVIENNSFSKKQSMKGWRIKRTGGDRNCEYVFPDIELKGGSIKIWARNASKGSEKKGQDLEADFTSWGSGNCYTVLEDDSGNEKATHNQRFAM
ncbi:70 kDa neurofilament protein-like [Liolophura sinensis]|uniref:70 kDa neurofilament protein-like n=1 Tax=Liolophura sinensis TaxID=3198878 RepID=UPI00315842BA